MPTDKPRITFALDESMLRSIDDYKYKHRIKNQSQAIISLIEKGLNGLQISNSENEKSSPVSVDTEEHISMEESNLLFDLLIQSGLIQGSSTLTDDDRAFLLHIIGLLDVWSRSKRQ